MKDAEVGGRGLKGRRNRKLKTKGRENLQKAKEEK